MSSKTSNNARAGLILPVGRVKTFTKKRTKRNFGTKAAVGQSAVLEYLVSEIVELAIKQVPKDRKRVTAENIHRGVKGDEELAQFFHSIKFVNAGNTALPRETVIRHYLAQKSRKAKKSRKVKKEDE